MPFPPAVLSTLSNGIPVATVEMPHMESVAVGLWNATGSRHETEPQNGVVHLIEHLVFKGTPTRTSEEISRQIEGLGASVDGFTSEDHTGYQVKGPAESVAEIISVIADFYQNPRFDEEDFESERAVIHEEIAMVRDLPGQLIEDLTSAAAWPGHPLGRPITGTAESLDGLTPKDVAGFHRTGYAANRTCISLAGNIRHRKVAALCEEAMGSLGEFSCPAPAPAPDPAPGFAFSSREDTEQIHVAIGFHACNRYDESRFAQKLLSVLLGENMSSRVFQELRERSGLCYEVQSDISAFDDAGLLHLYLALAPENLDAALESIRRILHQFTDREATDPELDEAKRYTIGQSRIALENTASQMIWAGECLLTFGEVKDPDATHQKLVAVTPREILELARTLFRQERLVVSAVGPARLENRLREWQANF